MNTWFKCNNFIAKNIEKLTEQEDVKKMCEKKKKQKEKKEIANKRNDMKRNKTK